MAMCGPKLSLCCMLLSVWGVIMLALLGIFFRINAPALSEDLPIDEDAWHQSKDKQGYISGLYSQASTNCFIAAGLYVGTFVFSFVQFKINQRNNYTMS